MKCKLSLFSFLFMLTLTCNLNAQDALPEVPDEPKTAIADVLEEAEEELDKVLESDDAASDDAASDDGEVADKLDGELDELDADGLDADELDDEESEEDEESKKYGNTPISIKVNDEGQLVGQAKASVNGNWLPVEANIVLVSDGVTLSKIVADPDGSFAFQDIAPGSYDVYGTASSYCGLRTVTVLPENGCCDNVGLGLTQDAGGTCFSDLPAAPAATFAEAPSVGGGFGGGGGFATGGGGGFAGGGGGVAAGGGAARGVSALRLLGIGGIATAIAVSDDDDDDVVSPSN